MSDRKEPRMARNYPGDDSHLIDDGNETYYDDCEAGRAAGIRELLDILETALYAAPVGGRLPAIERVLDEYRARYPAIEPVEQKDGDNGGE